MHNKQILQKSINISNSVLSYKKAKFFSKYYLEFNSILLGHVFIVKFNFAKVLKIIQSAKHLR